MEKSIALFLFCYVKSLPCLKGGFREEQAPPLRNGCGEAFFREGAETLPYGVDAERLGGRVDRILQHDNT